MAPDGRSTSSSTMPSSVPNSSTQSANASTPGSTSSVTKRGKAKNNTLINHIARRGQKPRIEIPPGKSKPVGDWSQQFASEVGIICREYAPLSLYNWRNVKKEYKSKVQTMHGHILKSFDIDIHLPHIERAINKYIGQRLKEFRCRLHVYYKSLSNDQRRRKPYVNVAQEDWERLCDWFETDKFKKLSTVNKAIRAKKKVHHRGGSRSFLNHRADKRNAQTQQEPGRIEFYRMMYYNQGKGWSGSVAEENYDKMLKMQAESLEEGSTAMTEEDIANKVLGTKPCYIVGLGHGVDPMSSSSSYCYPEVEELRRRAEAAETQAEEHGRQAQELRDEIDGFLPPFPSLFKSLSSKALFVAFSVFGLESRTKSTIEGRRLFKKINSIKGPPATEGKRPEKIY
ncbi:Transposase, Ptta/En/Spm, plant [Cinnamomum micranthum f. kanehirae]|uniref:Transposase, Ptta/En/Spm, plant n=1 Tax=Cinnamomum micranthum f. kanehirae TaxID=337451 RepID=A0A3S3N3S0_9MAGN|nr:Transposase, Ptta/En/Spm, plant [Cinnamomum micranthum f. kanehirae]